MSKFKCYKMMFFCLVVRGDPRCSSWGSTWRMDCREDWTKIEPYVLCSTIHLWVYGHYRGSEPLDVVCGQSAHWSGQWSDFSCCACKYYQCIAGSKNTFIFSIGELFLTINSKPLKTDLLWAMRLLVSGICFKSSVCII